MLYHQHVNVDTGSDSLLMNHVEVIKQDFYEGATRPTIVASRWLLIALLVPNVAHVQAEDF